MVQWWLYFFFVQLNFFIVTIVCLRTLELIWGNKYLRWQLVQAVGCIFMIFKTWKVRRGHDCHGPEATGDVLLKNIFLKISQNSQESTCVRVSFLINCRPKAALLKETQTRVFPCEFCEIFKKPFLQNTSGPLLLIITSITLFLNKKLKVIVNFRCSCKIIWCRLELM